MLRQIFLQLNVELYDAVHGDGDRDSFETRHPDVCIPGVFRTRAVATLRLCDNGNDGKERPNEAVLKYADPDNLRPVSHTTSQNHVYVR